MWRMWRTLSLLAVCCAVRRLDALAADASLDTSREKLLSSGPKELGKPDKGGPAPGRAVHSERRDAPAGSLQPTTEPLEDELDNQENIISQLLGDYDKVKTESSGSDCVCRCVVRPIKRSDCSRILDSESAPLSQDFYTVETITKGTDCKKCVCMAPPSAVNPCEGEYRFKKLQEASKDDIKLATIIDLLEGSLYGIDLLKLNSVTTQLLAKVDNLEKVFTKNLTERTREKERMKEKNKDKDKKVQLKKKKISDSDRSEAAASDQKQKSYESQIKKIQQQDGQVQQQPTKNETETKTTGKDKSNVLIRGVTFYKAAEDSYKEEEGRENNAFLIPKSAADLLIDKPPTVTKNPRPSLPVKPNHEPKIKGSNQQQTTTKKTTTTTRSTPVTVKVSDQIDPTTPRQMKIKLQTKNRGFPSTTPVPPHTTDTNIRPPSDANPTTTPQPRPRRRLSWTESPADQPKATKKPAGVCKDTVASISEPAQQNSYGLRDGAWMKDARGHGKVIYLTNGHYGNSLLEFRDMDTLKSGQPSNSYKLPYDFTGTGHVVFNGAFFYNRAFSRDVIRFDLRRRFVSAWTTLHDAILEEQTHRTQTEVEFAVDESGLWLLYPALDTEGFHQEVILLIQLHHRDLQPIQTFRTGLRRGRYGNTFLVCGVLYGVDSMEHRYANVTYGFDTHTLTHTVPSLAFTNMHTHTSQVSYNPLDKKLYAWDSGHQMNYDVIFAY